MSTASTLQADGERDDALADIRDLLVEAEEMPVYMEEAVALRCTLSALEWVSKARPLIQSCEAEKKEKELLQERIKREKVVATTVTEPVSEAGATATTSDTTTASTDASTTAMDVAEVASTTSSSTAVVPVTTRRPRPRLVEAQKLVKDISK
jgi:hypothetical protein